MSYIDIYLYNVLNWLEVSMIDAVSKIKDDLQHMGDDFDMMEDDLVMMEDDWNLLFPLNN